MKMLIPLRDGTEQDALTGWRKVLRFRPGTRKSAKRSYAKRLRKFLKRNWSDE